MRVSRWSSVAATSEFHRATLKPHIQGATANLAKKNVSPDFTMNPKYHAYDAKKNPPCEGTSRPSLQKYIFDRLMTHMA
jgi:hypothetical protein